MSGTPGPVSGFAYSYFMVYYMFSIAPPNMRLQVEAQLRTPGIIALVTFLLTRVLLSTQTRALSIKHLPQQAHDAKSTLSHDDKDISTAFDSRRH